MKVFINLLKLVACIFIVFILLAVFFSGIDQTKKLLSSLVIGLILFLFWKFCSALNKEDADEGID